MSTLEPLAYRRPPPPRRRRWLWPLLVLLVLVLLLAAAVVRAETETTPKLSVQRTAPRAVPLPGDPFHPAWPREGEAAVAVEGLGSVGASGGQAPVPIASVAKVMTAYLVLKQHPLAAGEEGFRIRISRADVADLHARIALDQSVVEVRAGEVLSERQALEALLLPSANNVAALLAVHEAGSVEAFAAEMNEAAAELGMTRTHYTDPSGFEATTVSTAADQIKLARAAMADPAFAEIVAMPSARLPVAGLVPNYNELVGHEGFVGIKTGSDEAAGGCLLFAKRIEVGGRDLTVLGAVFGQREGELVQAALASANRLAASVAAAVRVRTVIPAGTKVMVARGPDGHRVAGITAAPVQQLGWAGMPVRVKLRLAAPGRSLDANQHLGTLTAIGTSTVRVAVVAGAALPEPSLVWRLRHLL
ncbi:MAG: D-alanyl-D-alanine carboxypeptidase [Actinobacteria bacterium]|nr:D-alanyl-D-alanine carboxypeptidase [Actinomycetota bacterium]